MPCRPAPTTPSPRSMRPRSSKPGHDRQHPLVGLAAAPADLPAAAADPQLLHLSRGRHRPLPAGRRPAAGAARGPGAVARSAGQGRDLGEPAAAIHPRLRPRHGAGGEEPGRAAGLPDRRHPARAPPSLAVTQPAIYFGELGLPDREQRRAGVRRHPSGDENVYTRYQGHGDVALDSWLKRLVYAWRQFDINILISDYIRSDSRIQLWRQVRTRVGKLAPFLTLDHNPYLVVDGGRLFWIQDAYTTGERFPYAEPAERRRQLPAERGQGRRGRLPGRRHVLCRRPHRSRCCASTRRPSRASSGPREPCHLGWPPICATPRTSSPSRRASTPPTT